MRQVYLLFDKDYDVRGPYDSYSEAEAELRWLHVKEPVIEEWDERVARALYHLLFEGCRRMFAARPVDTIKVNGHNAVVKLPNSCWAGKWEFDGQVYTFVPAPGVKVFQLPWHRRVYIYENREVQDVYKYAVVRRDGRCERWLHVSGFLTNAVALDKGQYDDFQSLLVCKSSFNLLKAN